MAVNNDTTYNPGVPVPNAGSPGPFFTKIPDDDIVEDQRKVTDGFFSGGVGTVTGNADTTANGGLVTASLSTTQKQYYYNLQYNSTDQLSVTYGHLGGSGSKGSNGSLSNLQGETEAIYKSFANLLA